MKSCRAWKIIDLRFNSTDFLWGESLIFFASNKQLKNTQYFINNIIQLMGKTTYSRNPSTSKGNTHLMQSPNHLPEISEFIIKIPMRLLKPSKVSPSPKPNNISKTSSDTEDVFPTLSIMEESAELVRQPSLAKHSEDGPRNQSKLFWDLLTISNQTPMLKIWRI